MELNEKELAQYNGQDGKPPYVAAEGKIYDVSESKLWKKGLHMNRHQAGADLTHSLAAAPHGPEVLQRLKEVGTLKKETSPAEQIPLPRWLVNIFEAYPFFKRHPHPMVVHFPMTFFVTAALFLLWYHLISPVQSLLDSIFYLHILGTLSLPVVILTGWLSWKVNYMGKPIGHVRWKIYLSTLVAIIDVIVLVALITSPGVLAAPQGIEIIIPIFVLSYLVLLPSIGYHGGQLVY